jgi:glycosyltransferase involved in cell wall biosynthesis
MKQRVTNIIQKVCGHTFILMAIFSALQGNGLLEERLALYQPMREKLIITVVQATDSSASYKKNLDSLFSQRYQNFHIIYIDDCSTDGTAQLVADYTALRGMQSKITIILNTQRRYALANLHEVVQSCPDNAIITQINGDDWLEHNRVFSLLNKVYSRGDVWATYGQCLTTPYPDSVIANNSFRKADWRPSQLQTFYAWLLKKINKDDLCYHGQFARDMADVALGLPLYEMAGKRLLYIPDSICSKNSASQLNDSKSHQAERQAMADYFKNKKSYKPLTTQPIPVHDMRPAQTVAQLPSLASSLKDFEPENEKHIFVVVASYNNAQWYRKNLDSIYGQNYSNYAVVYVDDCSTDRTGALVDEYVKICNQQSRTKIIHNTQRKGALENIYKSVQAINDEVIIVIVDGDDWLATPDALSLINKIYSRYDVWLTYGSYQTYNGIKIFPTFGGVLPEPIVEHNTMRQYSWVASHMRTFYAGLLKRVREEDLQFDGVFFDKAADLAIMFPMLEMAGKHSMHVPDVLYTYNGANVLNDYKVDRKRQLLLDCTIRLKQSYSPLPENTSFATRMEPDRTTEKLLADYQPLTKHPIAVVVLSYNNNAWYKKNMSSILTQDYENFSVVYADDNSPDGTAKLVEDYVNQINPAQPVTVIQNQERLRALGNMYKTINALPDETIVVLVDGDDWLAHNHVLSLVNKIYNKYDAWMTYGSFIPVPDYPFVVQPSITAKAMSQGTAPRKARLGTPHLRTFKAGLFKRIKKEDLCFASGKFFDVTGDLATILPMLEMAGPRAIFVPDTLYVYNMLNPLNDFRHDKIRQEGLEHLIRMRPAYEQLETLT